MNLFRVRGEALKVEENQAGMSVLLETEKRVRLVVETKKNPDVCVGKIIEVDGRLVGSRLFDDQILVSMRPIAIQVVARKGERSTKK